MTHDNEEPSAASDGSVGQPRNGALSGCETVPDADSRVWETHPPVCHVFSQKNFTLTDAEREAVRYMIAAGKFGQRDEALTEEHAATLRGLLERLK